MKTKPWAILLMFFCAGVASAAQILFKSASYSISFNILKLLSDYHLWIGLFLYGIAALLFLISLKGGEVSILYPIMASSYIWVSLLSVHFFQDTMNSFKWIGVFLIITGITFIGLGREK